MSRLKRKKRIQETCTDNAVRNSSFLRDALIRLSDTTQSHQFEALHDSGPNITGMVKLQCDATETNFLHDPLGLEVEETGLNITVDNIKCPNDKWGLKISANGGLSRAGEGQSGGDVSLKYEFTQGTDVNIDVGFGENGKVGLFCFSDLSLYTCS